MTEGAPSKPRSLKMLVHGHSKGGKSHLADTAPGPRLHLDAEGGAGTDFTSSVKTYWDPLKTRPPEVDGEWQTCVVYVNNYDTFERVYEWLNSGHHPFRSVIVDSISEVQQRCIDGMVGVNQMQTQDWGGLLREVSAKIRGIRDLTTHKTNPLTAVVMCAMTTEKSGRWVPYVQGQLATRLPYFFDIVGWMYVQKDEAGREHRRLFIGSSEEHEAGERVGGALGAVIDQPNVARMIDTIYGPEKEDTE